MSEWVIRPSEIEARSMAIISAKLEEGGIVLPPETVQVVKRVIHTTADFDYVRTLFFTPDAVSRGIAALRVGTTIITDTNMALAGISRPGLERLGVEARCFMAEEDVAAAARAAGTTRAMAAVEKAFRECPGAILAVGNAPTALLAIVKHIREGAKPALVVGVPVGFVNVEEAKEEMISCCTEHGIPAIIAKGRKGGSSVAAAIANALIYEAAQMSGHWDINPANAGSGRD